MTDEVRDRPDDVDMQVESEESDVGLKMVKIVALTQQAEIDLAMEYPRIVKLLARDWKGETEL